MARKKVTFALTGVLLLSCIVPTYAASINNEMLSDNQLLNLLEDALPESDNGLESKIYIDDYGNFCYDISVENVTKDNVVSTYTNKKLSEQYDNVVSVYLGLSDTGRELLDTCGKEDKMFVVKAFDDVNDDNSDLIFCCIDGSVVYNCTGN